MNHALSIVSLTLCIVGCNSGERIVADRPATSATGGAASGAAPAAVPAAPEKLPPLGEAVELDQGRVSIAGPADWTRPPRDPKWLARFEMTSGTPYPSILIQTPTDTNFANTTKANVTEFARAIQAQLQQELAAQGFKVPEVKPLVLERFAGVEYSRQAKLQSRNVQLNRLYLVTVFGGRQYTIELHALYGTEATFRPHALAVAEGLQFHPAGEPAAAEEKKPDDK